MNLEDVGDILVWKAVVNKKKPSELLSSGWNLFEFSLDQDLDKIVDISPEYSIWDAELFIQKNIDEDYETSYGPDMRGDNGYFAEFLDTETTYQGYEDRNMFGKRINIHELLLTKKIVETLQPGRRAKIDVDLDFLDWRYEKGY